MSIDQLKLVHPMPWAQKIILNTQGGGTLVQIVDKKGKEVPLLTMTEFVISITQHLAATPPGQPQPTNP